MTENATQPGAAPSLTRWGVLFAWLAARPRGRWATARGRCVQTGLTASLLLAGLAAWALALVQPWTGRPADRGIVTIAGGMDTGKIRAAAADVDRLCAAAPTTAKPPRRNPFAPKAASAAPGSEKVSGTLSRRVPDTFSDPGLREPRTPGRLGDQKAGPADGAARAGPAAQAVLEAVRGLRLEVILTTPAGERWAVINGRNLREGDRVAGLEIVEIQEGRVRLQQGGVTCLLRMD